MLFTVPIKKLWHTIQMTNDRPLYILPLVNVYWPIIGHLYCKTSFFYRDSKLLQINNFSKKNLGQSCSTISLPWQSSNFCCCRYQRLGGCNNSCEEWRPSASSYKRLDKRPPAADGGSSNVYNTSCYKHTNQRYDKI